MSRPPRPIRPLPGTPAPNTDEGLKTGITTRILIVGTIVIGQLWALTVGLEEYLSGHTDRPWWLAAFSILSFLLAAALVWLEPPARDRRRGRR
ncbi:MAG TPA: hypothetical protein VMM13_10355 [Euzebya sp.]|nr:hypothetical protein [Euzebya sp.]